MKGDRMKNDVYVHPYETTVEEKYMDECGYGRTRNVKRVHRGMTLRDHFAASYSDSDDSVTVAYVCDVIGVSVADYNPDIHWFQYVAKMRYQFADAMMKAREVQ
jgi:hypothetical protein